MKVIVLSIDAARPDILESQVKLGNMPSLEGMLDRCFMFKQCETTYPPATATAHAAMITGCNPRTSGITGNLIYDPGTSCCYLYSYTRSGLDSRSLLATPVWKTLSEGGLKQLIIAFPLSWPPVVENTIGGFYNYESYLYEDELYILSTAPSRGAIPLKPIPFQEVEETLPPLEATFQIAYRLNGPFFKAILLPENGSYAKLMIVGDGEQLVFAPKTWSDWLKVDLNGSTGYLKFRFEIISQGHKDVTIKLVHSEIYSSIVSNLDSKLSSAFEKAVGHFLGVGGAYGFSKGRLSQEEFLELLFESHDWVKRALRFAIKEVTWDILWIYTPLLDFLQHAFLGKTSSENESEKAFAMQAIREGYRKVDELLNEVKPLKDVHVFAVSDHGMCPLKRQLRVNNLLREFKLLYRRADKPHEIDIDKSKAFFIEPCHIFLNKHMPRSEFEDLKFWLKSVLLQLKDPVTGERVFEDIMLKEDSHKLGLGGDRTGDLVLIPSPNHHLSGMLTEDTPFSESPFFLTASHETSPLHEELKPLLLYLGPLHASFSQTRAKLLDLYPTILSLFKIRHGEVDGKSLLA
ncbi:MAG: hypothetical protein DRJ31_01600 [Candidatus Methanomethylicota archaeon]|uniref:Nucleotide pyrophosphatase n=1 Tax=Thermoproteota archaeon TaxID=2056631 RepID=A0A497ETL8_9CREN|nr:MAG: hypothetical protein DRJ31_01600 [Candidatus Verstraetearchaeota archaeon]